jgi:transcriptional regulator
VTLSAGYLTPTQKTIWDLKSNGLSEAGIARKLNVTRQTIHKALDIANSKVLESLEETATINKIKIETINISTGVLVGYSAHFKTKALITFSAKNGIRTWYKHEGDCKNCEELQNCKHVLVEEAKERNIPLPKNIDSILPSEFANVLFSEIIGDKER